MDEQLLSEFLAEAEELIEELQRDLAALRSRRGEGRARRELVGRIFRHVHTLKGSAATAGLTKVSALAHEFESVLDAVRAGRAEVNEEVLALFDEALDALAAGPGEQEARGLIERLRRSAEGAAPPARGAAPAAEEFLPADVARSLGQHERQRAREALGEGASLFVVDVSFDIADFDERFRALCASLTERGEVISTLPGVHASAPERVGFRLVHATEETSGELAARVRPFGATLFEDARAVGEEGAAAQSAPAMLLRVPLEELDDLIAATHELFAETLSTLDLALEGATGREPLEARAAGARQRFRELEERLIGLRMVPVRATLERAARVGRAAARAAGKQVDFEITGGDVRLDKSLAERVADPLLHLLRNAVDHGVETPEERLAAGKPERGLVRLEASAEGGRVALRVSDDGRGVDVERVARAAFARGLAAPGREISEAQALRLIFRPGFSTAERAGTVSGRGVGLDVVERAVEAAGGELRVSSRRGRGTAFELRLPTTLALVSAVAVSAAGRRYCLDARRVVADGEAERVEGGFALWRGERIPCVELRSLLGLAGAGIEGARVPIVVAGVPARRGRGVGAEGRTVAVVVDAFEGRGEVLVRGLGRHAARWRGVSGATELGDGTTALVLDLAHLLAAE